MDEIFRTRQPQNSPARRAGARRAVGPHDCRASEDHRIASSSARWFTPPPTKAKDTATPRPVDDRRTVDASAPVVSVLAPAHRRLRPCPRVQPSPAACRDAQGRPRRQAIPFQTQRFAAQANGFCKRGARIQSRSGTPRALASRPAGRPRHRSKLAVGQTIVREVVAAACGGRRRRLTPRSMPVAERIAASFCHRNSSVPRNLDV